MEIVMQIHFTYFLLVWFITKYLYLILKLDLKFNIFIWLLSFDDDINNPKINNNI